MGTLLGDETNGGPLLALLSRRFASERDQDYVVLVAVAGNGTFYPRRILERQASSCCRTSGFSILVALEEPGELRTYYPEPPMSQLPATAHFFGSKGDRVTIICDTEALTADQNGPG
jgi:hypothetical protein